MAAKRYDPVQLAMGIIIEQEHGGLAQAEKTAKEHLRKESPRYYDYLVAAEGRMKRGLAPNPSSNDFALSLELVCGSSDAPSDHPGYFDGSPGDVHPAHTEIERLAKALSIGVSVSPSVQGEELHSDAYLYFDVDQLRAVVQMLKRVDYPGDILDVRKSLSTSEMAKVKRVAQEEGWHVNTERGAKPNPPPDQRFNLTPPRDSTESLVAVVRPCDVEDIIERAEAMGWKLARSGLSACLGRDRGKIRLAFVAGRTR